MPGSTVNTIPSSKSRAVRSFLMPCGPSSTIRSGLFSRYPPTSCVSHPMKWPKPHGKKLLPTPFHFPDRKKREIKGGRFFSIKKSRSIKHHRAIGLNDVGLEQVVYRGMEIGKGEKTLLILHQITYLMPWLRPNHLSRCRLQSNVQSGSS